VTERGGTSYQPATVIAVVLLSAAAPNGLAAWLLKKHHRKDVIVEVEKKKAGEGCRIESKRDAESKHIVLCRKMKNGDASTFPFSVTLSGSCRTLSSFFVRSQMTNVPTRF
jgi:hypothetical protein